MIDGLQPDMLTAVERLPAEFCRVSEHRLRRKAFDNTLPEGVLVGEVPHRRRPIDLGRAIAMTRS
jgi:hypothetical protein